MRGTHDGTRYPMLDGARSPGGKPLDMALTAGDGFLYVLDPNHQAIQAFAVGADGTLAPREAAFGLPPNAVGLAAR